MSSFAPRFEPAKSIYLALEREAAKRPTRNMTYDDFEHSIALEREAVLNEAVRQAQIRDMRIPTMEDIKRAEIQACGHVDYMAKFAYGVVEAMRQRGGVIL